MKEVASVEKGLGMRFPFIITLSCLFMMGMYSGEDTAETPAPHVISLFIVVHSTPDLAKLPPEQLKKVISTPGTADLALMRMYHKSSLVSGIPCLYLGTLTYSDVDGHIVVPRVQESDEVVLIISDRISPVIRHGNTVDHWILREKNAAARFLLKRTITEKNEASWSITDEGIQNIEIPQTALVLLAPPSSLRLPPSPVPTHPGPHLLLPDIEAIGEIPLQLSALNTVAINRFFAPVYRWGAYAPDRYSFISTD